MRTVTRIAREAQERGPTDRRVVIPVPVETPSRVRSAAARVLNGWSARLTWELGRTGRPGLIGVLLLLAAGVFLVSTHLRVAAEVERLRAEVAVAEERARHPGPEAGAAASGAAATPRAFPGRGEMPVLLRQIFTHATQAKLGLDSGKYEVNTTSGASILRHHVLLPVNGPYERIREFVEATLTSMPAVGLRDLAMERKAVGDASVDARIRLTVYTLPTSPERPPAAPAERRTGEEEVAQAREGQDAAGEAATRKDGKALFAMHSWYVIPVVPVPPPPPAPAPTAPPFPYAFLGSYAPDGAPMVYFLSRQDGVIYAHVGDRLDGVYQFESAENGQLVFVYLPLDVRQTLSVGAIR